MERTARWDFLSKFLNICKDENVQLHFLDALGQKQTNRKSAQASKSTYWLSSKETLKAPLCCDLKELEKLMTDCMFRIFFKKNQHKQRNLSKPYSPQITALSELGKKRKRRLIPASVEHTVEWRWGTHNYFHEELESVEKKEVLRMASVPKNRLFSWA